MSDSAAFGTIPAAGGSLAAVVAQGFVEHDVPDASSTELAAVAAHVDASLAAMPDVTRLGVRVAGLLARVATPALRSRADLRADPGRRARAARSLARTGLPIVSEYVRLTRGLGAAACYDQRTDGAPMGEGR